MNAAPKYEVTYEVWTVFPEPPSSRVVLKIPVPSRVAALVDDVKGWDGWALIQSANIAGFTDINHRARSWKHAAKLSRGTVLPTCEYLEIARREGLDSSIMIWLKPEQWHLVGMLCGKLGISPGDWFAGCATYNAEIEEERIDEVLSAIG